jgi:hypothetical protein
LQSQTTLVKTPISFLSIFLLIKNSEFRILFSTFEENY